MKLKTVIKRELTITKILLGRSKKLQIFKFEPGRGDNQNILHISSGTLVGLILITENHTRKLFSITDFNL